MQTIHYNIRPLNLLVREKYLYNMDIEKKDLVNCTVIGLSSYPGHTLTVTILVKGKFLYSYVPLIALAWFPSFAENDLNKAIYKNCPSSELTVTYYDALKDCTIYNKDGSYFTNGQYILTLDWYNDNEQFHLIKINDGNFVLYPNHKIIFNSESYKEKLPQYRKSKNEWILGK
jgi:hypothetical protein